MAQANRSTYLLSPREILLRPLELGSVLKRQSRPPAPTPPPRPGGARVQVRSFDLVEDLIGAKLPRFIEKRTPDHAYVEYDDGAKRIIARGGPSAKGLAFWSDGLNGRLRVVGHVQPASDSVDNGRGTKVLAETFIPGRTAGQVAQTAKRYATGVNRGQNLYGAATNSNSFAQGAYGSSTGGRMGAPDAWGHGTRLGDGRLPADLQRSRELLGPGLGSTNIGRAITKVAEDAGGGLKSVPYMPGY